MFCLDTHNFVNIKLFIIRSCYLTRFNNMDYTLVEDDHTRIICKCFNEDRQMVYKIMEIFNLASWFFSLLMTDVSIALYVKIVTSFHTCAIIGVTT